MALNYSLYLYFQSHSQREESRESHHSQHLMKPFTPQTIDLSTIMLRRNSALPLSKDTTPLTPSSASPTATLPLTKKYRLEFNNVIKVSINI